jgi:hypothetical protein
MSLAIVVNDICRCPSTTQYELSTLNGLVY